MENNAKMVSIIHTRGKLVRLQIICLKEILQLQSLLKNLQQMLLNLRYVMIRYIYHR